jgi:predicted metal-dependent phosphoesterase TrpH
MIDLHCHSYFSDGELSPGDLLSKAIDANISILALTDHDTIAGLSLFHEASKAHNVKTISGVELSVRWKKYDLHVLGLNINIGDSKLAQLLSQQNEARITRAHQIGECLAHHGILDAYKKASEIAGHERVGRPHFAQVLINEGVVGDMQAAFKRFLGQGKSAYVPTAWIDMSGAVDVINAVGGDAVIAHPLKYRLTRSKLHELIKEFKSVGGGGLEVVSGEIPAALASDMAGLCQRFDLLASTGSDYHGDLSRVALGQQRALPVNCRPIWHRWNI